ncbi:MAG: DALR domain-containing protein, partial [Myxococcota bacterium]
GIEPLAFRLFFLGAHYRQQQTYSDEAIRSAQTSYRRLVRHAVELRAATDRKGETAVETYRDRFRRALADDLNAPQGLAVLWELLRSTDLGGVEKWGLVCEFDQVLGLELEHAQVETVEVDEEVETLIREREQARAARDFARADAIRDQLLVQGIVLEDSKGGTTWRRA